jgi:CBS domain-containing protein
MREHSVHASAVPRLGDLRLRPVVSVGREVRLDRAARVMRAHEISALVVGEPGDLVSVVTERDLCGALADGLDAGTPVAEVASPEPLSLPTEATVLDAAMLMLGAGVRHVIVTLDSRAVGVVSMRDVLATMVRTVTPEAVLTMVEQVTVDTPGRWLV